MTLAGKAFIVMWHDITEHAEADYDRWHTREHMPERLSIPGFRRGRRGVDWDLARHRYLTIYEGDSVDVFGSPSYLERLNNPTPWTARIAPEVRNFIRGACDVAASVGQGVGGVTMTIRIQASSDQLQRLSSNAKPVAEAIAAVDGVASVHVGVAQLAISGAKTRETQLRGDKAEETFDGVIVVDGTSRRALAAAQNEIESILQRSGLPQPPEATAIYDVSYVLTSTEAQI
jgi:hypothetical protein